MSNNEIGFKDSDLREALRRKYANTLTLLANLKEGDGQGAFVIHNISAK